MKKGIRIFDQDGRKVVQGMGFYEPKNVGDLREVVKGAVRKYGNAIGFQFKNKERQITGKSYIEFDRDIDSLGTALLSLGLKDAHISILSENRYEWGMCYFSIVNGTGVAVPLDKYLPLMEVENLVTRGSVEAIFYSAAYQELMIDIARNNPKVKYFICFENVPGSEERDKRFIELQQLLTKGKALRDQGDRTFTGAHLDRDKMSVLLFTSGTTSMSKGVMLSHANIAANVSSITSIIYAGPGDVHLSLLPLHHTFENTIGLIYMVHSGVSIAYCDGIKYISQNMQEYKVTVLVAVPAIFEAMYKKMQEGIKKAGKEKLFSILLGLSDVLRVFGIDLRRKFFKSVFEKLGPHLRLAVSGAAPLDPDIIRGFNRMGLKLIQGYGLTETAPVVAATNDFVDKAGTIGYPMAGIEVAVDSPDENGIGELITRGSNVMLGYYENPTATSEAIDSKGWFKTGDMAKIDEEGFISITGRVKSMIVLTNGKKAFPEEYETMLNNLQGVKESFVWGNHAPDGDIQVCAKLVIDEGQLMAEQGTLLSEKEIAALFDAEIRSMNKSIPQYKIIRYFVITKEELIKTTTLKIKRMDEQKKTGEILEKAGMDMRKATRKFI